MLTVQLKKHQLDRFRAKARKTPLEIEAILTGILASPELVLIQHFHYTKRYFIQSPNAVCWSDEEFAKVKLSAETVGQVVVGSIHSHPNWYPVMSPADYDVHIEEKSLITGICGVLYEKTKVYFWAGDCSLPCSMEYV